MLEESAKKPSGIQVIDKPLPKLLDDMIAYAEKAEHAADHAEQAAQEAKDAASKAVADAISALMGSDIEPMRAAIKLAQETGSSAINQVQGVRDMFKELEAAHNDLVDKYNKQLKVNQDLFEKILARLKRVESGISTIMVENINSHNKLSKAYSDAYTATGYVT